MHFFWPSVIKFKKQLNKLKKQVGMVGPKSTQTRIASLAGQDASLHLIFKQLRVSLKMHYDVCFLYLFVLFFLYRAELYSKNSVVSMAAGGCGLKLIGYDSGAVFDSHTFTNSWLSVQEIAKRSYSTIDRPVSFRPYLVPQTEREHIR